MNGERGITDYVILFIGFSCVLFLIGFFRADRAFFNTVNFKASLNLECGLTQTTFKDTEQVSFPVRVQGYVNGCGWEMTPSSPGSVQIFDAKGAPVTTSTRLQYDDDGTELPRAFMADVKAYAAPSTDTGNIIFTSSSGMIKAFPVRF